MKFRLLPAFLFLTLVGCASTAYSKTNLLRLAPSSSVLAARISWEDVRGDERLRRITNADAFLNAFGELSIASDEITEFVVFSDSRNFDDPNFGIILRGTFNSRDVIQRLAERGWAEEGGRGFKIFSSAGGRSSIALLRSGGLVFGKRSSVESVLGVELSPRKSLASAHPFAGMVSRFAVGNQPISAILALPREYQFAGDVAMKIISIALDLNGLGFVGSLFDKIGFARGLGCSISRNGTLYPIELIAVMKDEGAASFVSSGLQLLKGASSLLPESRMTRQEKENMQVFQSMAVNTQGPTLSIKVTMRERDLVRR